MAEMDTDFAKQTTKERVLNFLRLINLHDEAAAQEQFEKWLTWCEEEAEGDYEILMTFLLADWGSAYYADFKETDTLVCQLATLAARYHLKIDWDKRLQLYWGDDEEIDWNMFSYDDEVFDKITVADLLVMAGRSLQKQGHTLWFLYTGGDEVEGWITASDDDKDLMTLVQLLNMGVLQRCTESTRSFPGDTYFTFE